MEWKNGHQPRILGLTASYLNGRSAADFPDIFVRLTIHRGDFQCDGFENCQDRRPSRWSETIGGYGSDLWLSFMPEKHGEKMEI